MTTHHVDTLVRRAFLRNRQLEDADGGRRRSKHRWRYRNECIDGDGAIRVLAVMKPGFVRRMRRVGMAGPMGVNSLTRVVIGNVVVGMRMNERRAQAGSLESHGKRDRNDRAHGALIVQ